MSARDEDVAAGLLERLLSDPDYRAAFRADPVTASREAGLDERRRGDGGGPRQGHADAGRARVALQPRRRADGRGLRGRGDRRLLAGGAPPPRRPQGGGRPRRPPAHARRGGRSGGHAPGGSRRADRRRVPCGHAGYGRIASQQADRIRRRRTRGHQGRQGRPAHRVGADRDLTRPQDQHLGHARRPRQVHERRLGLEPLLRPRCGRRDGRRPARRARATRRRASSRSRSARLPPSIRPTEIGSPWALPGAAYFTDGAHQNHIHIGFDDPLPGGWKPARRPRGDAGCGRGAGRRRDARGGAGRSTGARRARPSRAGWRIRAATPTRRPTPKATATATPTTTTPSRTTRATRRRTTRAATKTTGKMAATAGSTATTTTAATRAATTPTTATGATAARTAARTAHAAGAPI